MMLSVQIRGLGAHSCLHILYRIEKGHAWRSTSERGHVGAGQERDR